MKIFTYSRPSTQKGAVDAVVKEPTAKYIAGGTNLIDLMKKGVENPDRLIDINNLPLKEIRKQSGVLQIGALALNSDVSENNMSHTNISPF